MKHPNRPEWPEAFDLGSDSELTAKLETELTAMMTTVKYTPPANADKPRDAGMPPANPQGH